MLVVGGGAGKVTIKGFFVFVYFHPLLSLRMASISSFGVMPRSWNAALSHTTFSGAHFFRNFFRTRRTIWIATHLSVPPSWLCFELAAFPDIPWYVDCWIWRNCWGGPHYNFQYGNQLGAMLPNGGYVPDTKETRLDAHSPSYGYWIRIRQLGE